ncbi:RICIN domain-containing protein [Nonomuraea sp. NPDC050556]|uniref:RICIN domain-containing protein n=1 Tax=Nonomuraea sp. NPDC050556 TaxID=3364369 RepID=UPI0037BB155A
MKIFTAAAGAVLALSTFATPAHASPAALVGGVFKAAELIQTIVKLANNQKDREIGVKALMEKTVSETRGEFNIIIAKYEWADSSGLPGPRSDPDYTFEDVDIEGTKYGVWIFDEDGTFVNTGDGGYLNWRFYAPDGFTRDGGKVHFNETAEDGKHDQADKAQGGDWDSDDEDNRTPDPGPGSGDKPAHGKKVMLKSDNGRTLGPVSLWDKGNGLWEIEPTASGSVYEVVPDKWTVQTGRVNHGSTQQWMFHDGDGDGRYSIVNRYNRDKGYSKGGCLTADGNTLWAIDCNKPSGQLWTISSAS